MYKITTYALFDYTLLYTTLIVLPNRYIIKDIFWEIYRFFLKNGIAYTV